MAEKRFWPCYAVLVAAVIEMQLGYVAGCDFPPQITYMEQSVDVTKLEILPGENSKRRKRQAGDQGFRQHAITKMTCVGGKKFTLHGSVYDEPDIVSSLHLDPASSVGFSLETFKTMASLSQKAVASVGLKDPTGGFFSASLSFQRLENTVLENEYIYTSLAEIVNSYVAKIDHSSDSLSANSKAFIDELPRNYTGETRTTGKTYEEFIRKYGTHVFTSVKFGGAFFVDVFIKKTYYENKGDAKISSSVKILAEVAAQFEASATAETSIKELLDNSKSSTRVFGGTATFNNASIRDGDEKRAAWRAAVVKDPYFIAGTLYPLAALFPDPEKKLAMQDAVDNYIWRSALEKAKRQLNWIIANYKNKEDEAKIKRDRVDELLQMTLLPKQETEDVTNDVSTYVQKLISTGHTDPNESSRATELHGMVTAITVIVLLVLVRV